jgi:hypothetical protein
MFDNNELNPPEGSFFLRLKEVITLEEKKVLSRLEFLDNFFKIVNEKKLIKLVIIFTKKIENYSRIELTVNSELWQLFYRKNNGEVDRYHMRWENVREKMNAESNLVIMLIERMKSNDYDSIKPEINIRNLL